MTDKRVTAVALAFLAYAESQLEYDKFDRLIKCGNCIVEDFEHNPECEVLWAKQLLEEGKE